jgi:hypothetical protein
VASNVLGLGYVRLTDDIADGEIPAGRLSDASALATRLFETAVAPYRQLLPHSAHFWDLFGSVMETWRSAPAKALAERGAPLKVSASALLELAGRRDLYPALEECLDHGLAAMVLYDHFCDWREDLEAGRWNAFVAAIVPGPATPARVTAALMAGVGMASYFARIEDGFGRAANAADDLGINPLADHFRATAADIRDQGARLAQQYSSAGERALGLVFGTLYGGSRGRRIHG